ncbi:MAG TPA: phytoene/squalene synthase family protein [Blastocatellia bacterium]|nr:phytoene/squalene synthase family protein [Blastocatellia bacterium]HMV86956.1 phytoene/squalene synthase family protein [Blastocatellia bacterium]HMX30245.1 phytoene/squalene synthase family protein [Blastocatellia bacterium]HMY72217.1 phytoene/squalene synthase family protein [Blastocatellia bacterium]HMZ17042.1 phytoene/squalene synthase family protein [Blastocatellia bacterium]
MTNPSAQPEEVWSQQRWRTLEQETRRRALAAHSDAESWEVLVKQARLVLKTYSTSFFIVTRFLPPAKRAKVEAIYAAVRYPDEVVDTFPLTQIERTKLLDDWSEHYDDALRCRSLRQSLEQGAPCFVAAFAEVVRECGIPPEHYRAFLDAMRLDVWPRAFATLDDLIESYIYGSAIVVGYFLTYVYGSPRPQDFERALKSARDLGIALQLTNFLRDVAEDQRRGRVYLPLDLLRAEGIDEMDATDPEQQTALNNVLRKLTAMTERYYESSLADLDAFHHDSRVAIRACIDVYRQLNARIAGSPRGLQHRESVPMREKFRVLPPSKYWRLPLAYLRA